MFLGKLQGKEPSHRPYRQHQWGSVDIWSKRASLCGGEDWGTESVHSRPQLHDWSLQIFSITVPAASYFASAKILKTNVCHMNLFAWTGLTKRDKRQFLIQFTLLIDLYNQRCVPRSGRNKHTHGIFDITRCLKLCRTCTGISFFFPTMASKTGLIISPLSLRCSC